MNRKVKVFETKMKAIEFAKMVNGNVKKSYLSNYMGDMSVHTVWVVEWYME